MNINISDKYIINQITMLDFDNKNIDEIPSLTKYIKLIRLMMNNNKLKTIPELPKSLKYLSFKNNYVTELPILPPRLLSLNCGNNKIEVLPNYLIV